MRRWRVWKLLASAAGFTIPEVLVAVGIITLAMGLVGASLFQAYSIQRFWQDDVMAVKELRHADSWFALDALNASATNLVDGAPPVSSVTLTWTDRDLATHTATYSISGNTLVRSFDGIQTTVARDVVSVAFSRSGRVLTFDLEVTASRGGTERRSLQTYLRMLP